jgi:hypothetical protein
MIDIDRRTVCRGLAATVLGIGVSPATSPPPSAKAASTTIPAGYLRHPQKGLVRMTSDLAKLDADHFESLVGQVFKIGDGQATLRTVRRGPETPGKFRDQFSLMFETPEGLRMGSEVVTVEHPAIGRQDLLVTQVMDGAKGTALQICFS